MPVVGVQNTVGACAVVSVHSLVLFPATVLVRIAGIELIAESGDERQLYFYHVVGDDFRAYVVALVVEAA